jgi:K+/H+ antiporter YhaU regulatory subunit KhtT
MRSELNPKTGVGWRTLQKSKREEITKIRIPIRERGRRDVFISPTKIRKEQGSRHQLREELQRRIQK